MSDSGARGVRRSGSSPRADARPAPAGALPADAAAAAYAPRVLVETLAAHPGRPLPWWEWVDGTLVMADVSGFTALSERLAQAGKEGAEWLTDVINRFFGTMLDVTWHCGGTTITFGGDAILLLFYGDDHERRGIVAALRMLNETQKLAAYHVGKNRVRFSMSMGAHAGRFLTASVGAAERAQYLIVGPETVMTAQAEARASAGELAISAELAHRVAPHAEMVSLDEFFLVRRLVNTPRYEQAPDELPRDAPPRTLAAYLPPFVADAVGATPPEPVPELDHEHRNVTVAFVNVLGVDDLLASDGPEALVDEMQRYMEPVTRLVEEHDGYLVSNDIYTNGFKLIVAFGAPVAHEHDVENAFRFAATLNDEVSRLDLRLSHRIGINGGFVYAGDVGPAYRRQYTVMGDAVNLSARLMSAAEPGQVIVSMRSADAAGDCFLVRELPPVRVKGKEQPIEIGALEGQCDPTPVGAGDREGFFGREDELRVLTDARDAAEGGNGRTVVIRGEAGMGKSRLASEFEKDLPERGWSLIVGRAYQHTARQPYAPWIPAIGSVMGLAPADDEAERSRKALASVQETDPMLAEWTSLLNGLLGLSLPQSDLVRSLDASSQRDRMFDLIAGLVRHETERSPVALHFEDAHWADRSSLDLLERVALECGSARLLVIVTERLEGAPELDLPPEHSETIDLTDLPHDAALELMGDALKARLPAAIASALLDKTHGNPLFLHEVARSIGRSAVLTETLDEHSLARAIEGVDVPDRVQSLLMSRIDGLALPVREVLRTASVIGTTFPVDTLRGTVEMTLAPEELEARLAALVDQSMLVEKVGVRERAYDFQHALIQEVAYDSLPFGRRRDLHHRVAGYLEDSHTDSLETVFEALVHHFRLSGDQPKTRAYAVKAGEKARDLLASDQAIDYFRIGLDATGGRNPEAALARSFLLEQIGDCYHLTGRHHEAADAYKAALRRCGTCQGDATSTAMLLEAPLDSIRVRNRHACLSHKVGVSYTRTHGDYRLSLRWLDTATETMGQREAALTARIEATRSVALVWTGEYQRAVDAAMKAYASARRIGDREVEGRAATTLAGAYQELGDLVRSIRYRLRALESYKDAGNVPAQAEAHSNLSATYICRGDLTRALHHAREALKIDERTGDLTGEGITRCNLAEILVMRGEYDEAARHLRTALGLFARAGGVVHISGFVNMMLSRALMRDGKADEAAAALEESMSLLKKSGATTFVAEAQVQHAELLLLAGDYAEALSQCQKGWAAARRLGMRLIEMRALWIEGRILAAMEELQAAERSLKESDALARKAAAPYEQGLAKLALAELYAFQGRAYRAVLARAIALLEPTGALPDIERAHELAGISPA